MNVALGRAGLNACAVLDQDGSGAVEIAELTLAVGNAQRGCAAVRRDLIYASGDNGVSVIDAGSGKLLRLHAVGPVSRVAVSDDGSILLVGLRYTADSSVRSRVLALDAVTGRGLGEGSVPGGVAGVSFERGGDRVWVWHTAVTIDEVRLGESGTVVFDRRSFEVIERLDWLRSLAVFDVSGDIAYALHGQSLVAIDVESFEVVSERPSFCCVTSGVYLHPRSSVVFVRGNEFGGFLAYSDFSQPRNFAYGLFLRPQGTEPFDFLLDLAFSPDGDRAYVPGVIGFGEVLGALFVVDTSDPAEPKPDVMVELPIAPGRIAVSSAGDFAYLLEEGLLHVLDLATYELVDAIELPGPEFVVREGGCGGEALGRVVSLGSRG